MPFDKGELSERLLAFGAGVVRFSNRLPKTTGGRHIGGQVLRSSTSAGANYEEACGAESRQDFVHKMQVVLKELRESFYWLRLIHKAKLVPASDPELSVLLQEARELCNIIAKSIVTAKRGKES